MGGGGDSALRVENLQKVFRQNPLYSSAKDKVALKGVSFTVRSGEVFAFLGHNGAGKTTTLNLLCGVFAPTAGDSEVDVDLKRVTRHTSHVTRHTTHVTRHTSHVTRHTSHVTLYTSHVTRCR